LRRPRLPRRRQFERSTSRRIASVNSVVDA
jgi:hypothetical protein